MNRAGFVHLSFFGNGARWPRPPSSPQVRRSSSCCSLQGRSQASRMCRRCSRDATRRSCTTAALLRMSSMLVGQMVNFQKHGRHTTNICTQKTLADSSASTCQLDLERCGTVFVASKSGGFLAPCPLSQEGSSKLAIGRKLQEASSVA